MLGLSSHMPAALILSCVLLYSASLCAQSSQEPAPLAAEDAPTVTLSAFLDSYYAYDFSRPSDDLRPGFLYNHNRHNEFSLNMALIDVGYRSRRARAQLGLMAGTYPQYNYAAEPQMLQSVFEAWAGAQVLDDLWWDAGIFPSHIGYESAISTRNPTLTRSLASENTPYFLSGTRLSWTPDASWMLGVTLANGWQNIVETPGNSSKGGGTQVTWTPDDSWTFNSSTWISDESPAGADRLRLFHDFYGSLKIARAMVLLGADVGAQRGSIPDTWDVWWAVTALARVDWHPRVATALRVEYYQDPNQVIVSTGTSEGLRLLAGSLNLDVHLTERAMWRVEGRAMRDAHAPFALTSGDPSSQNIAVTTSLAIDFDATFVASPK